MDNKLIIGIVIGAIALLAIVLFATNPAGQAMLKYSLGTTATSTKTVPATTTVLACSASMNCKTFTIQEYHSTSAYLQICKETYYIDAPNISTIVTPNIAMFKVKITPYNSNEYTQNLKPGDTYILTEGSRLTLDSITEGTNGVFDTAQLTIACPQITVNKV